MAELRDITERSYKKTTLSITKATSMCSTVPLLIASQVWECLRVQSAVPLMFNCEKMLIYIHMP